MMHTVNDTAFINSISDSGRYLKLCFSDVSAMFEVPITQAAAQLGVSESHLKRQCRLLGIERWPQRRIRSLKDRMKKLTEAEQTSGTAKKISLLQGEIDSLYESGKRSPTEPVLTKRRGRQQSKASIKVEDVDETEDEQELDVEVDIFTPAELPIMKHEVAKEIIQEPTPFLELDLNAVYHMLNSYSEDSLHHRDRSPSYPLTHYGTFLY